MAPSAAGTSTPPAASRPSARSAATPDEQAELLREFLAAAEHSGLWGAVLVVQGDRVLADVALGNADGAAEPPIRNTTATRFDIGSVSKQFAAAAVLRLQMQGKLSIDDPVVTFFPEVVLDPEHLREDLTLRHLLTHTSLLPRDANFRNLDFKDRDQVMDHILSAPPFRRGEPGEAFLYSNLNYFLIAAVIEKVAGKPFEEAVRELVFEPAGLSHTMFCGEKPDPAAGPVAHGYEDAGSRDPTVGDIGPADERPFAWGHRGATGVLTTTHDLLTWRTVLSADGFLDAASRAAMFAPGLEGYALGWYVLPSSEDVSLAQHAGTTLGFEADVALWMPLRSPMPEDDDFDYLAPPDLPAGTAIIGLYNRRRGAAVPVRSRIIDILLGKPVVLPPTPVDLTDAQREQLQSRMGVYEIEGGGALELTEIDEGVRAVAIGQDMMNTLILPAEGDAEELAERTAATAEVLQGWMTGEAAHMTRFFNAVHERVPQSAARNWATRWASANREGDPIKSMTVLGSTRGDARVGYPIQTFVRLDYERRPEIIRLFWRDGSIYGIGLFSLSQAGGPSLTLVPESESSIASLNAGTWSTIRLVLAPSDGGSDSVVIVTDSGDKIARKRPPAAP
ncbi:MAG: beta-lactamase family protein [Phycisphaeraceae bacterium]|nr:beta-lactamase family protein [Phycisphaeraceae bacterium]